VHAGLVRTLEAFAALCRLRTLKARLLQMEQMMYLCSLLPFGKPWVDGLVEVSVQLVHTSLWRVPELRFVGPDNVSLTVQTLSVPETLWMSLFPRRNTVKLTALMTHLPGPN